MENDEGHLSPMTSPPAREDDDVVARVTKQLIDQGYIVVAPDTVDETLKNRDIETRAQAIQDAAEIVLNGHSRHQTPMQLAIKLKQMADRVRAGARR